MKAKRDKIVAVVSGASGMDGSHMIDYLLTQPHIGKIIGLVRRSTKLPDTNIKHLLYNDQVEFIEWDIMDVHSIERIFKEYQPNYFLNFAAQSHVHYSWDNPLSSWETNATGVLNILETIRKYQPDCRFYQAGSSEQFGDVKYSPQDENHPFSPRSVYGVTKCAAHYLTKTYRESYGLYALTGICFNHEGPRRHESFITRKVTKGVARIYNAQKRQDSQIGPIRLGNLQAQRDWSHAVDFMDGIWRMMNQEYHRNDLLEDDFLTLPNKMVENLNEYVFASGETYFILDLVESAFDQAGFETVWEGNTDLDMKLVDAKTGQVYIEVDPQFFRPAEVDLLHGDPTKAKKELGWEPKYNFESLVEEMVRNDLDYV